MTSATTSAPSTRGRKRSTDGIKRNPGFYAQQKQQAINEFCSSKETVVRFHCASSQFVPTNNLRDMLRTEADAGVLAALLTNPRMPVKAIEDFAKSDRASLFPEGHPVNDVIKSRVATAAANPESEAAELEELDETEA